MNIGERLRLMREDKKLSQGDVEKRTGLLRCYISRVENGHTVPALETLEKLARALDVPLYVLFYEGKDASPPEAANSTADSLFGARGKDARFLARLQRTLGCIDPDQRRLLMSMAEEMSRRRKPRAAAEL